MTFKGSLILSAGSTNIMDVLSASLFDVLKGTDVNALVMSGETVFDFTGNTTVTNGSSFAVLQNWGSRTIDPGATFTAKGLDSALSLDTSKLSTTGVITVIPEPAAISLLGLAGIMMLVGRRWIFSRQEHPKKGM
jgi:hypothetical protein